MPSNEEIEGALALAELIGELRDDLDDLKRRVKALEGKPVEQPHEGTVATPQPQPLPLPDEMDYL